MVVIINHIGEDGHGKASIRSNPEHSAEYAVVGGLRLTDVGIAWIEEAFPLGPQPSVLPSL
jgi:hypothetical protein